MKKFAAPLLAGLLALAGWTAWRVALARRAAAPVVAVLAPGTGARAAARELRAAGVVAADWELLVALRLLRGTGRIQAGEYEFTGGETPLAVARMLVAGRVKRHEIRLPPGGTVPQLLRRLADDGLLPPTDPATAGRLADRYEGMLAPDTYLFSRPFDAEGILSRMESAGEARWTPAREARLGALGLTRREALIRASIVEKETALDAERPLVAGVIVNRLRAGMPLQMDPTNLYGAARAAPGTVASGREAVRLDTPWSTYHRAGLPPTPICAPSLASLDAALAPAATDALYYVADGSGGHRFARTYDEHLRNIRATR